MRKVAYNCGMSQLALPPHKEPTYLDLFGYGDDYDERLIEQRHQFMQASLALQELSYAPFLEFFWMPI